MKDTSRDDELCRAVLAVLHRIQWLRHAQPCRIACPEYDRLVQEGRLSG